MATVGAVLYSPGDSAIQYFGFAVPTWLAERWARRGQTQIIAQVELFAIVCARWVWRHEMGDSPVLLFTDNAAALEAVIKCASATESMLDVLRVLARIEAEHPARLWYSRVPSPSNPSDGPSRLDFSWCRGQEGSVEVQAWREVESMLANIGIHGKE